MKKLGLLLVMSVLFISCQRDFDRAMKSADKQVILNTANKFFEKKKWTEAIALYERLPKLVAGTSDAAEVVYKTAYANYNQKSYRFAAHQFKNFANTFNKDPRQEEAAYMAALCYYQGSLEYELDQENTVSAINELQDFINTYPNSERSKNINQLIEELSNKIELKAYENARKYYKMEEYKSAIIAFENVLSDFPATKLKSKIDESVLNSKYELAVNSIYELKEDRIKTAITYCKELEKYNKDPKITKKASELRLKLEEESLKFQKLKIDVEKRNKELKEKIDRLTKEQEKFDKKEKDKEEQKNKKWSKETFDSNKKEAEVKTPEAKSTFKIKNYTN